MSRYFCACILFATLPIGLLAQRDSVALRFAATITEEQLRQHLNVLAHDSLEGRDTGKEGQKKAAAYLSAQFRSMGIPPVPAPDPAKIEQGYLQPFMLVEERSGSMEIAAKGDTLRFMQDIFYVNEELREDLAVRTLIYMGDVSEIGGKREDLRGASVLLNGGGVMADHQGATQLRNVLNWANEVSARFVLVMVDDIPGFAHEFGHGSSSGRMRLLDLSVTSPEPRTQRAQVVLVARNKADALLTTCCAAKLVRKKAGRSVKADFTVLHSDRSVLVQSENVLAYVEGTDKKEELVIITAHYDHVGVEGGVVYNGADDDGSGTVALLEIAEAFALAKAAGHGPKRSVLVMPVSGEEKGLLGSRHYSDDPVFPLENTIADLNIDMIGRTDSSHTLGEPYVYVIGSDRLSNDLHRINELANEQYVGLTLDYTFNAESDPNRFYYRSDHYNFARKGIPSIFYFSGVHEDYHQPTDDVEKIRFDLLLRRTLLVFHTAWALANAEMRPVVDKPVR